MKIPNKRELQLLILYKKCTEKPNSFWLRILLLHQIIFWGWGWYGGKAGGGSIILGFGQGHRGWVSYFF